METVLLTIAEADDNKNQRSLVVFLNFFIKNKQKTICKHHFPMAELEHRHPDGFKFSFPLSTHSFSLISIVELDKISLHENAKYCTYC